MMINKMTPSVPSTTLIIRPITVVRSSVDNPDAEPTSSSSLVCANTSCGTNAKTANASSAPTRSIPIGENREAVFMSSLFANSIPYNRMERERSLWNNNQKKSVVALLLTHLLFLRLTPNHTVYNRNEHKIHQYKPQPRVARDAPGGDAGKPGVKHNERINND